MNNYYNTVIFTGKEAHSDSWLDRMGSNLILPYRGRIILVHSDGTIQKQQFERNDELSSWENFKVEFGVLLKKIAAFFDKEIAAKYKLVSETETATEQPKKIRQPEGSGLEIAEGVICLTGIIACCVWGFCCQPSARETMGDRFYD